MSRFDTYVVRTNCVESLDVVRCHPNVKTVMLLPRDWLLYEFHHPLFQDPDFLVEGIWREKMQRFPELQQERIAMLNQERALLAPWYAKKKKRGDADALLASQQCDYRFCTLGRMRWIIFNLVLNWGTLTTFTLTLNTSQSEPRGSELSRIIDEWATASDGQLSLVRTLFPVQNGLAVEATCTRDSGHWLAALWALLSDARWNTGVESISLAA